MSSSIPHQSSSKTDNCDSAENSTGKGQSSTPDDKEKTSGLPLSGPLRGVILPNNIAAGLAAGGMNVASGLCSALAALSATNGARNASRSPVAQSRSPLRSATLPTNSSELPPQMMQSDDKVSQALPTKSSEGSKVLPADVRHEMPLSSEEQPTNHAANTTSSADNVYPKSIEKDGWRYKDIKASNADRRSSFFNEITRSPPDASDVPPRSASQYSVPHSSQPFNLALERSCRADRANTADAQNVGTSSASTVPTTTTPSLISRSILNAGVTIPLYGYGGVHRQAALFGGQRNDAGNKSTDKYGQSSTEKLQKISDTGRVHGSPRSRVMRESGVRARGVEGEGLQESLDKSMAPIRAVHSTGNLGDRVGGSKQETSGSTTSCCSEPLAPNSAPLLRTSAASTVAKSPMKVEDTSRKHFFSNQLPKQDHSGSADSPNDVFSDPCTTEATERRGDHLVKAAAVGGQDVKAVLSSTAAVSSTTAAGSSCAFAVPAGAAAGACKTKQMKQWTRTNRVQGSHSPGSRPKKSSNDSKDSSSSSPKQKETWKGKVVKTFKRYGSGPVLSASSDSSPHGPDDVIGVIGVPLEHCQPSIVNECVPLIVEVCARVVEDKGLQNQGIYRVPGNTGLLNQMVEELNKDPIRLCSDSDKWNDVNVVSSLLKLFFRKLPDPLITDYLYESVMAANRTENAERRMLKIKKLLNDLPEHNFETFHFIAQHLNRVTTHDDVNKMDARNLAIMFGPTLIRPQDDNMIVMVRDMTAQCRVVESIIIHCDWFFSSWDEDVNVPVDEDSEELNPISTINEELLAKAESLALRNSPQLSPGFLSSSFSGGGIGFFGSGGTTYGSVVTSRGEPAKYRELVSTIISAANRKIRHRAVTSTTTTTTTKVTRGNRSVFRRVDSSADDLCRDEVGVEGRGSGEVGGDYVVTQYTSYWSESTADVAREISAEESGSACLRRTQSSDSLLDKSRNEAGSVAAASKEKSFFEEFTVSSPAVSTPLSPQLKAQLLIKRQMIAKQQFLLHQQPSQRLQLCADNLQPQNSEQNILDDLRLSAFERQHSSPVFLCGSSDSGSFSVLPSS